MTSKSSEDLPSSKQSSNLSSIISGWSDMLLAPSVTTTSSKSSMTSWRATKSKKRSIESWKNSLRILEDLRKKQKNKWFYMTPSGWNRKRWVPSMKKLSRIKSRFFKIRGKSQLIGGEKSVTTLRRSENLLSSQVIEWDQRTVID